MVKEFIALVIGASTILSPTVQQDPAVKAVQSDTTQVVVRAGEYDGKPGKRVYVESGYEMPDDIPLHKDEKGYYIQEYDINVKLANRINEYLKEYGVNAVMQISKDKSEDLNAAGRKAAAEDPTIYLSVHHNYVDNPNVSGYVWFYNQGDTKSAEYAKQLTEDLTDNPGSIPAMEARAHDNYIGELMQKPGDINLLLEAGFFSNVDKDLHLIMSDEQIDYMAKETALGIVDILNNEQ